MSDDLVKRASYALHDLQGRVEAGKLAMFSKCIDRIEALEASFSEMRRLREAAVRHAEKAEAERDTYKARAERAEAYVQKMAAQKKSNEMEYPMNAEWEQGFNYAITDARVTLAQIDAEPTTREPEEITDFKVIVPDSKYEKDLADAYRAGLEAAAKRHVYYAHQYERINATADAAAHMEHARQIRALEVPDDFGGE